MWYRSLQFETVKRVIFLKISWKSRKMVNEILYENGTEKKKGKKKKGFGMP